MSLRHVRARNSNQERMSPSSLVSICETNLNDQFEPSFRDNRDRNSQQETTSLPTRWNKTKKQNRDDSRVVCKTFREDMSYPASAWNIPTNNKRRAKASWQQVMSPNPHSLDMQRHVSEDHHSLDTRCVNSRHANDWAQVVSPKPHCPDIQRHVSERTDRHSLNSRLVTDRAENRWRRSTASQISFATLLHRLESVERQNEELRQRMSEMDRSNPSSIHGTETTSCPAGSLSENDTSTNQRESDQISEPVGRPEIRRMTPSDDVEAEIDDLHRWYTAHAEIEGNGNMELAQSSASSTQGENGSYEATFQPEAENLSAQRLHDSITADKTENGEIGNQSNFDPESDNSQGRTDLIEASESPKSENTAVQHLHDSTVTQTSTKTQNGEFDTENSISGRVQPQNCIDGEFGPTLGLESPNVTTNRAFGPVSGPESPQRTNSSEFRPNGTESPQNQSNLTEKSKFCDFGPVSEPKSTRSPQLDSPFLAPFRGQKRRAFQSHFGTGTAPK